MQNRKMKRMVIEHQMNTLFLKLISLLIVASLVLTGCSLKAEVKSEGSEAGEDQFVVVSSNDDAITYKTVPVQIMDITATKNVNCTYVQTKEQEVTFPVGGKIISNVHVKEGDVVKVGDVLVELDVGNMEEEIAELEYKIAREELELGYLDVAEEFETRNSYYRYVYDSKMEEDDVTEWEERDESIAENYTYQREDKQDALEFDRLKLNKLKSEFNGNRVYATMSGTVYSMTRDLEGSTAKRGQVIMTIVDNANGIFEAESPDDAKYFTEGSVYSMNVVYGNGKGDYELMPYNVSSWGETQQFSIADQPENATLEVGTSGTIKVVMDSRQKVMGVPSKCVFSADDKHYVYLLDENNMRKVQFVEIGLVGDGYTEITEGLKVGDEVVKRS